MFEYCKNSNKQGDVGMCYAMAYFAKMGYTISIPITDSQDYDLIVDDGEKLSKVQVKTTKQIAPSNYYIVSLRTCGGNRSGQTIKLFNENNSDYLFVLTDGHEAFLIPKNELQVNSALTLNEASIVFKTGRTDEYHGVYMTGSTSATLSGCKTVSLIF